MTMINQNDVENQLPIELRAAFQELKLLKHLRTAGIVKNLGFSCAYLLKLIFCLIFQHRNWFRLLESKRDSHLPGKDAVYRFLNYPGFAWRRFLTLLSSDMVSQITRLTSISRIKVLIVDDSMYERNRSKKVELLARFGDHATRSYYKGFRILTLGWSDGHSFIPLDFALLSSVKSQVQGITDTIDKRTHGYRRRKEALESASSLIPSMLDRALLVGVDATHVLMDSWFTYFPLLQLQKEFQGRSYDMLISHTTIVFARYILLSWQHRQQSDPRSLGGLFLVACDEIADLDWTIALKQLLDILDDVKKKTGNKVSNFIEKQLFA